MTKTKICEVFVDNSSLLIVSRS